MSTYVCNEAQFDQLLAHLKQRGYSLLGPTVGEEAIVYEEIQGAGDLPVGYRDSQDPGTYRLKQGEDRSYFAYQASQHSWKQFLFPAMEKLWSAKMEGGKIVAFEEASNPEEKWALIGVLACDLMAIRIQERVFNTRLENYSQFHKRRENAFIVAINCTTSVNTCFCASMGSGPDAKEGYDLALTEVADEKRHHFLLTSGSPKGESVCKELGLAEASAVECQEGRALVRRNRENLMRSVDNATIKERLANSYESQVWDEVAARCINCANCTLVCPTCFCTSMTDRVNMDKTEVEREQRWESCFNLSHAYTNSGIMRSSAKARYRQWLTHKFGTWWDQFGTSGCVGCGRCIVWCPVGIDVTEELNKLECGKC